MSGKYALIIGNTEYIDTGLTQLSAPGKDAEDFARVLKSKDICDFDDVQISLNQPSTSVIETIDEFFDQKKPDDLLVLYFSGHGVKDEIGSLYLAFKNTVRSRLRSTAIKSDYIREAMDQSRSKRQVLILDCCNSGAFPQGIKAEIGGVMGMTKAFQGYGRFVLTASDATQFAWEGDKFIGETGNSLFTHFLVKGLEGEADSDGDGRITVDELYDYAYGQVSRVTPNQTPTKSSSKQEGEIVLRQSTRIENIKAVLLPTPLLDSIENPFSDIRLGAVQQLTKLLNGKNLGLARSAKEALERVAEEDDSRQVSRAAFQALEAIRQAEQSTHQKADEERLVTEKLEAELKATGEAERVTKQKAEEERIAKAKVEAKQFAEEKRLAEEKVEADRKAREDAERLANQKAEEKRIAKAKLEAERLVEEKRLAEEKAEAEQTATRIKAKKDITKPEGMEFASHAKPKVTEKGIAAPGKTAGHQPITQQQPIIKWIIIGIIGLCVLGGGAWGASSYLAGLATPGSTEKPATEAPTEAPAATESPATEPIVIDIKHGTLRVNAGSFPDTIDPQKSSFVNEIGHLSKLYEGLTKFNANLETIPAAAESWEYNFNATILTFHLRSGLVYSDGSVLNAKRFEYSLKRNINPATAGEYAPITDEILGAPEWRGGDASAKTTVDKSVNASHADGSTCADYDDTACNTLTLTFSKPALYFHTVMALWVAYPAKQENIEAGGETWWRSPEYQIGNGGWILKTFDKDAGTTFVSNPNYYGGEPYYDIEYKYIEDSTVAFEAYKKGELDIIASAAEDLPVIDADPALKAQHMIYPGSCTILIKFGLAGKYTAPNGSTYDSPFLDKKVREAFALGYDAQGWTKDVDGGLSSPTWTWIPPGFPGYDPTSPLKFDPEGARAALAASTYGGPEALNALGMKATFGDSPLNRQRFEWLVASYKEILGVDIALDPIEPTTFTAITKDPATFPLFARQGWCADYPDQQNWLSVYWKSTTTFAQRQGYANLEFDSLINQADVELDPVKRADLYAQAQQLLLADIPFAGGYNNTNHYLVQPWVKGIVTTPQDLMYPGDVNPTLIYIDVSMIP